MENFNCRITKESFGVKQVAEQMKNVTFQIKNINNSYNLSYQELCNYIAKGHYFLLADIGSNNSLRIENIKSISCLALDIDSKENKINMVEMISLLYKKLGIYPVINYCTFSDKDMSKFRLIYRLESKIDAELYKTLYKALQWKFDKYLDQQTNNPNRIWAGTNKQVYFNKNDRKITNSIIIKLVNSYNSMLKRKENKNKKDLSKSYEVYENSNYIKKDYKKDVMEFLIENINLKDYIEKHFGGSFKRNGHNYVGCCSLHGGDNSSSLVISKRIYTCFTKCGTGNIFTLAKIVYNESNFSILVFRLAEEYNIEIPKDYIREV